MDPPTFELVARLFLVFCCCCFALVIALNAMGQELGPQLEKQPLSADTPWVDPVFDDSDFNKQVSLVKDYIRVPRLNCYHGHGARDL